MAEGLNELLDAVRVMGLRMALQAQLDWFAHGDDVIMREFGSQQIHAAALAEIRRSQS